MKNMQLSVQYCNKWMAQRKNHENKGNHQNTLYTKVLEGPEKKQMKLGR